MNIAISMVTTPRIYIAGLFEYLITILKKTFSCEKLIMIEIQSVLNTICLNYIVHYFTTHKPYYYHISKYGYYTM